MSDARDLESQADRAIAGDPEAIRSLWESHRRWVAAVALAHMPRGADAPDLEDLLQEVAMKVVRSIHRLRDPSTIKPWLRTVTINVARTAARRRGPRLRLVREAWERAGAAGAPAGAGSAEEQPGLGAATREEGRRVMDAAMRLHPDYREPLLLRCVRGMSYRQIADALHLPVTTVETRLARARRMVLEELEAADAAQGEAGR